MAEDKMVEPANGDGSQTVEFSESREGVQMITVSMDPAFVPPSGSLNPSASVAPPPPAPSVEPVQAPQTSTAPAEAE